jgi:hypothetical protein
VVLGSGKPLFQNIEDRTKLELVDSKVYGNGVIGVKYQRV